MSAISLKSITGITSITTPAGVDNQLTLHNNNTTEAVKLDIAGNVHINNQLAITGVTTMTGNLTVSNTAPAIFFTDTNNDNDFRLVLEGGIFRIQDVTAGSISRFRINSSGLAIFSNNVRIDGDLDVDGHTNLDNVSVAGVTTFTGSVTHDSSINLGGELNFTGNGHKYIDVATLNGGNTLTIRHQDGGSYETAAYFDANGGGYLQFNGATKFATTNTGVSVTGNISATGNLIPSGTLYLTDAIEHTDDSNTKIRFPAADTFSVETAGTERLRITSAGNVGINGTDPNAIFSVKLNGLPGTLADNNYQLRYAVRSGNNASGYTASGININGTADNSNGDKHTTYLYFGSRDPALNGSHGAGAWITMSNPDSQGSFGTGQLDFYIRNSAPYAFQNDPAATSGYWMDPLFTIKSSGNIGVAGTTGTDFSLLDGMVINTGNGSAGLLINSSSSSHNAYLGFSYGSGSGTSHADQYSAYIGRVGDNTLILGTNNQIRQTIDTNGNIMTSGNVNINRSANAGFPLTVRGPVDGDTIGIERAGSYQWYIGQDGGSNLYFKSNTTKEVTFPYGGGIAFNGETGSNNTLNDYEEGTFTPTLSGGSGSQPMYYTKIGRVVHISGSLSFNNISGSGNIVIGGLPYTSINGLDAYTHLAAHAYDSLNVGNQTYQFQTLRVNKGTTNMMMIIPAGDGNIRTFAQYSHVASSTFRFRVAGYYITA